MRSEFSFENSCQSTTNVIFTGIFLWCITFFFCLSVRNRIQMSAFALKKKERKQVILYVLIKSTDYSLRFLWRQKFVSLTCYFLV